MAKRQMQATASVYLSKVRGKWQLAFDPAVEADAVSVYYEDDQPVPQPTDDQEQVAQLVSKWLERAQKE